jgi:hypothetical protein
MGKYSSGPGTQRGTVARQQQNITDSVGRRPIHSRNVIGPCQIEGIVGPEDADLEAEHAAEQFHIWVSVRLPEHRGSGLVRVPMKADIHTINAIYGSPGNLKGMFCNIEHSGESISDIRGGQAYITVDTSAVHADQERAETGSIDLNPLGALDGIFKDGIEDLIDTFMNPSNAPGSDI